MRRQVARFLAGTRLRGKRLLVLGILILLAIPIAALAPAFRANARLEAARSAAQHYDLATANEQLERYFRSRPDGIEAHLLAADVARDQEEYEAARRHLADCERLGGPWAEIEFRRSLLRAQLGRTEAGEYALLAPGGQEPARAGQVWVALARGHLARYYGRDAWRCADQAVRLRPEDGLAYYCRGRAKALMGQTDDSLVDYRRAVELAPRFLPANRALAEMLYRTGSAWDAAERYEQLRGLDPDSPDVLFGLGRCRHDLAQIDEARYALDGLLERWPDHVPGLVERARLAFRVGDRNAARGDLARAARVAPQDLSAARLLLLCLEEEGTADEVRRCRDHVAAIEAETLRLNRLMLQAVEGTPNPGLAEQIGEGLLRLGRSDDGLQWLYAALRADPHHIAAHRLLADYYRRTGQPERARQHESPATAAG